MIIVTYFLKKKYLKLLAFSLDNKEELQKLKRITEL